jgi:putative addiction module component (TIGR02574 family)
MTARVKSVLHDALMLSEKDRAEIAAKLLDSLDSDEEDEIEAAWAVEIQKRLDELDQGKVKTIPSNKAWKEIVDRTHGSSKS